MGNLCGSGRVKESEYVSNLGLCKEEGSNYKDKTFAASKESLIDDWGD
jgi:hypothetical protein